MMRLLMRRVGRVLDIQESLACCGKGRWVADALRGSCGAMVAFRNKSWFRTRQDGKPDLKVRPNNLHQAFPTCFSGGSRIGVK